jgi:hypothetical protein
MNYVNTLEAEESGTAKLDEGQLSPAETARLAELEPIIQRGQKTFVEVGTALIEIRERRLYREKHRTFAEYCLEKGHMTAARAYQLCNAAAVVRSLPREKSTIVDTESKARELARVPVEARVTVLNAAAARKGKVTAAKIRQAYEDSDILRAARRIRDERKVKQQALRVAERVQAAEGVPPHAQIIVGDMRDVGNQIDDDSLDLIFTDPPYAKASLELYDALGRFAARKLKVGGSLLTYSGVMYFPEVMQALCQHPPLRYLWTCAHVSDGGPYPQMRGLGIENTWKAILWFTREGRKDISVFVRDSVKTTRSKEFHEWEQPIEEAEHYIGLLCPQGGLVCDPFLGGGTTAAAADKLGRKWIGFEIDPATAKIASLRLAKINSPLSLAKSVTLANLGLPSIDKGCVESALPQLRVRPCLKPRTNARFLLRSPRRGSPRC